MLCVAYPIGLLSSVLRKRVRVNLQVAVLGAPHMPRELLITCHYRLKLARGAGNWLRRSRCHTSRKFITVSFAPYTGPLIQDGRLSSWAAIMTAVSLAALSPAAALAAVPVESRHMCSAWLLPMLQRVGRHSALCIDR